MDGRSLKRLRRELEEFAGELMSDLPRRDQRQWAQTYLRGLLVVVAAAVLLLPSGASAATPPLRDVLLVGNNWEGTADVLDVPTFNGLTVRELVIHLGAMESAVASTIGRPTAPDVTEPDIERRTAELVERFRDRPLRDARALWRASVDAVRTFSISAGLEASTVTCSDTPPTCKAKSSC